MVHSSFIYNPGLIVYSSKNLADWTPCSAALPEYNGDIWAPDLCVYNNRFYIYFPTRNEKGEKTNMVTWADSPEGPWSTPIDLKVGGIDPEHVTDDEGNREIFPRCNVASATALKIDSVTVLSAFGVVYCYT